MRISCPCLAGAGCHLLATRPFFIATASFLKHAVVVFLVVVFLLGNFRFNDNYRPQAFSALFGQRIRLIQGLRIGCTGSIRCLFGRERLPVRHNCETLTFLPSRFCENYQVVGWHTLKLPHQIPLMGVWISGGRLGRKRTFNQHRYSRTVNFHGEFSQCFFKHVFQGVEQPFRVMFTAAKARLELAFVKFIHNRTNFKQIVCSSDRLH